MSGGVEVLPRPADARASAAGDGALAGAAVMVVSHGFQPNYERGFCNGLAAAGADVLLIGSDRSDPAALHPGVELLNLRGSQSADRPAFAKALNLLRYHLRLMLRAAARRDRVVHVIGLLDPVVWTGLVQGAWMRLFARRYVLTVHNLVPHDRDTAFNRFAYGLAYRLADSLVVHTAQMAAELARRHRIRPERIVVMEHGVEPLGAEPAPAAPRAAGPLRLLAFGVVHRYKGLDLLLDALAGEMPPLRLRIVGICPDEALARELQARIDAHPLRDAIEWTRRFVDEAEVPAILRGADAIVMPYRHIDQSGVLFQALRHGVPVIASDVGALRDYVGDDVGIVVPPGDVQALADALRGFERQRSSWSPSRIREHARAFEWPGVVRALAPAYAVARPASGDRR